MVISKKSLIEMLVTLSKFSISIDSMSEKVGQMVRLGKWALYSFRNDKLVSPFNKVQKDTMQSAMNVMVRIHCIATLTVCSGDIVSATAVEIN